MHHDQRARFVQVVHEEELVVPRVVRHLRDRKLVVIVDLVLAEELVPRDALCELQARAALTGGRG